MNAQTNLRWLGAGALFLGIALVAWPGRSVDAPKENDPPTARLRRPVALVLADKGRYL